MRTTPLRAVLLVSVLLSGAQRARADAAPVSAAQTTDALQRARDGLSSYHLEGGATLALLRDLAEVVADGSRPERALEARFLRAAVAADFVVVARKLERPELLEALSEALGIESARLFDFVRAELSAVAVAQYAPQAKHALSMLASATSSGKPPAEGSSTLLADLYVIEQVAAAARAENASHALAELASPTCNLAAGTCDALSTFERSGQRSLLTLLAAADAHARVQSVARAGDPLAQALLPYAGEQLALVSHATVCPAPAFEPVAREAVARALPAGLQVATGTSTLALHIDQNSVRSQVLPCLQLSQRADDAAVELQPSWSTVALPATFRPYIHALDSLQAAFSEQLGAVESARVVVFAESDVLAHVLARVLISLPRAAEQSGIALVTRDSHGVHARSIEVARAGQSEPSVRVRVRLGGYSLYLGSQFEDIPRVRTESGFAFDRATLEQRLSGQRAPTTQISFMPEVTSREVLAALSTAAERTQHVQIMIP